MKMRQYIAITDHILWDIITNGDQVTTDPASSHLLSFHDATNAKKPWTAIKARFRGNEASKKGCKRIFETQHSRLLLLDLEKSLIQQYEIATMIRGQPGLDELEFDDLYNNLKVPQAVQTAPNCASHSDEIICSFFAQQASMPTTHDDEDLLQIDEDAIEEIDIRWQVAMITARIRKFMRKTGRPIDLKPKNGITFDKSKIECFNCQKLGHFARECRFAKYQENRANGRQEKRIVAIEDSNSKALVATTMKTLTGLRNLMLNRDICHDGMTEGFGVESSSGMESDNSSGNTNSTDSLYPNFQKTKGFHSVPPPTDWVDSDDEETVLNSSDIQKKTVLNSENSETSFENKSPSSQNSVGQGSRKTGLGQKGVDALGSMTETGQAVGFVNEFLCDITFFYVEGDDVVISSHSEGFSPASCHGSLDESLMEDVNILEDDGLLAMHEIIHWVYNITKAEYVACAKLLCLLRITPCHPPMLEVVTTLAAEEAHSTSPHSRAASSARDAQGTPDQSAAQASISQGTAEVQLLD
ncbi:ribonuclease H-like domain-containing protein [Tanacetum coccineum]